MFIFKGFKASAILIFIVLLTGCKSSTVINSAVYTYAENASIPYQLNEAKTTKNKKLLLIIPDFADSVDYYKSALAQELIAANYQILIPERRGANYSEQEAYDIFDQRVGEVEWLVQHLLFENRVDTGQRFVIYGNAQGAYVAATLIKRLKPDYFILQNNVHTNFIAATKQMLQSDNTLKIKTLERLTLLNFEELNTFISAAEEGSVFLSSFQGKNAGNWNSYSKQSVLNDVFAVFSNGLQLTDSTYLFTAKSDVELYGQLLQARQPKIEMIERNRPLFGKKPLSIPLKAKVMEGFGVEEY